MSTPFSPPPTSASTLQDHPTLQPAFHLTIQIGPALPVGSLSRGQPLTVVPLVEARFVSVPGFDIHVDASARLGHAGVDYVKNDPDGGRMRLTSDLVVGDDNGETIHIHYTGIVDITNEMRLILGRSVKARTTEFGHSFIQLTFETGGVRYKSLEQALFVGAGRFVVEERRLTVEYRISKVCKGPGIESVEPVAAEGNGGATIDQSGGGAEGEGTASSEAG